MRKYSISKVSYRNKKDSSIFYGFFVSITSLHVTIYNNEYLSNIVSSSNFFIVILLNLFIASHQIYACLTCVCMFTLLKSASRTCAKSYMRAHEISNRNIQSGYLGELSRGKSREGNGIGGSAGLPYVPSRPPSKSVRSGGVHLIWCIRNGRSEAKKFHVKPCGGA